VYFAPKTEFVDNFFWIGALRDEGSTSWYWEDTGAEITKFYWGPDEPSMDAELVRSCIDFSSDGWYDDDCGEFFLDVMCENK